MTQGERDEFILRILEAIKYSLIDKKNSYKVYCIGQSLITEYKDLSANLTEVEFMDLGI